MWEAKREASNKGRDIKKGGGVKGRTIRRKRYFKKLLKKKKPFHSAQGVGGKASKASKFKNNFFCGFRKRHTHFKFRLLLDLPDAEVHGEGDGKLDVVHL